MKQLSARISENKRITQGFYKMRIESAYLAKNTKPGQFLEIRCSGGNAPLLRRPFSAHRISGRGVEILYEVVGKSTEMLSCKMAGSALDVIGPLGNGFDLKGIEREMRHTTILVAGGIGVAPLMALAEELVRGKNPKIHALIGACSKEHALCVKEFKRLKCEVQISTEDGSLGKKGLVTESLISLLSTMDHRPSTIYACGPLGMLKAVAMIANSKKVPCQVSLEERMACGVGVCLGCPVRVKTVPGPRPPAPEYKMVCKDGPVFDAKEIAW